MIQGDKEKLLNKYSLPITIDETEIILKQMKNGICKIENKNGHGTGFFCQLSHLNKKFLITNHHVISEEIIKENEIIRVTLNDNKIKKNIKVKCFYYNKDYDTTIIEIEDENIYYLELDEDILDENSNINNESVYIIQYPIFGKEQKAAVSYGILTEIEGEYNIQHYCSTNYGSSGSPILRLSSKKIVGIHNGDFGNHNFNKGVLLKYPIKEYLDKNAKNLCSKKPSQQNKSKENMKSLKKEKEDNILQNKSKGSMNSENKEKVNKINLCKKESNNKIIQKKNEIKLTLKIEKKNVNKQVFFLDNFIQGKHCHDNLKELNQLNTQIFINNIKYKYGKCYRPEKDGLYEIKIKFNIKIKDCSYMFYGCSNLINIDLSSFDTSNVNNMSHMFDKCYNLTNLDLSSFDTKNVTDMSFMFSVCSNLTSVNLSSFDTKNVTNMSSMFSVCSNLTSLNLSSFDTKNVTDMNSMFYYCSNITDIDISSFDTENVTNISNIFYWCSKLNLVKINNNSSNIIEELKYNNNNNDIKIVDQSGKNISYINSNLAFKNNNLNSNMDNNSNNNMNDKMNNNMNDQISNQTDNDKDSDDDNFINSIKNWCNICMNHEE